MGLQLEKRMHISISMSVGGHSWYDLNLQAELTMVLQTMPLQITSRG